MPVMPVFRLALASAVERPVAPVASDVRRNRAIPDLELKANDASRAPADHHGRWGRFKTDTAQSAERLHVPVPRGRVVVGLIRTRVGGRGWRDGSVAVAAELHGIARLFVEEAVAVGPAPLGLAVSSG